MAAAVEAPPVHSTARVGTSTASNVTLSCQDLGNIVHLEHLNLEVGFILVHATYLKSNLVNKQTACSI